MVDPESVRRRLREIDRRLEVLCPIEAEGEDSAWTPEDYGSTFTFLARMGVIDGQLAERLKRAAGLRNVIVHGYVDVDVDRLWEGLSRVGDLEDLARAVTRHLDLQDG